MEEKSAKSKEIWIIKFDEDSAQKFRTAVLAESLDDPMKPIVVYIDSYGGYVDSMAKMIETMDEVPNPIITVCMGKAMSCGAILLSHGDLRFCGKHSRIMVHEVSSGTSGDVHDVANDSQETTRLNQHFMGLLARNCGFKNYDEIRALIKEQDGRDRYLSAHAAVEFGIVDAVGLPQINMLLTHEIKVAPQKASVSNRSKPALLTKKSESKKKHKGENNGKTNKNRRTR
jgi:ATP-dependent Clp protease protease subunit